MQRINAGRIRARRSSGKTLIRRRRVNRLVKRKQLPRIVPLSLNNIDAAKNLLNKIFLLQERGEKSDFWLPASLDPDYKRKHPKNAIDWLKYWVAMDKGKVIGVTGLYSLKEDKAEAYWLTWYGVDPAYREKGIGGMLLDFAIRKAKVAGKRFCRVYTSPDDPNEAAAQIVYEKRGFVTKGKYGKRRKYKLIFKELQLK